MYCFINKVQVRLWNERHKKKRDSWEDEWCNIGGSELNENGMNGANAKMNNFYSIISSEMQKKEPKKHIESLYMRSAVL